MALRERHGMTRSILEDIGQFRLNTIPLAYYRERNAVIDETEYRNY